MAFAWAVEFGEKDALPAAEGEFAVLNEDELRCANEHGFDVRVGVPFGMTIGTGGWNEAVECAFRVSGDVGIGVFVDENSRGGMRYVEKARADLNAERTDYALDFQGDVHHLGAPGGPHANRLH